MGSDNLQGLFHDIFALAQHQHKTIAEMWTQKGLDLVLRRNLNDWEIPTVTELYKFLENFQGLQRGENFLWWNGHSKGIYKVKKRYKLTNQIGAQIIK